MCRRIFSLVLLGTIVLGASCTRQANIDAVDELRLRLISNQFEEMYENGSSVTRAQLSREDFISKMRAISDYLKDIDPEIKWSRSESLLYDPGVFRDDNFSSMDLESRDRKINVQIAWVDRFQLCGISVFSNPNDSSGLGFRFCD